MIEYLFIRPTLTENEDYLWYSYDFESGWSVKPLSYDSLGSLPRVGTI